MSIVDRTPLTETELRERPDIATVDFGSDGGNWTKDGECDDPRFVGPGMTDTALLADDILNDATDCHNAYEAGRIRFKSSQDIN
ncbi:MAG: hypothetical protein AAF941_10595 [Pseudomonadota bacterium]